MGRDNGIGIHEDQDIASRNVGPGVSNAPNVVDPLWNDCYTEGARDLRSSVGALVVDNEHLDGARTGRDGVTKTRERLWKVALLIERGNDDAD